MTSCKDAIKMWEQAEGKVAAESEDVRLCPISLQAPVIQKMDASLSSLKKCKHLRLSTNSIDKITGLNGMECLTILSLGRNQIRKIEGLEAVQDTLEQLWVSYNQIGSLAGIEKLHNLQVLYISNNKIDKWAEVERLKELPKLRDLLMVGNPLYTKHFQEENNWRVELLKRLPNIKVRWLPSPGWAPWLKPSGESPMPLPLHPRPAPRPSRLAVPQDRTPSSVLLTCSCGLCASPQTLDGSLIDDDEREQAKAELAG